MNPHPIFPYLVPTSEITMSQNSFETREGDDGKAGASIVLSYLLSEESSCGKLQFLNESIYDGGLSYPRMTCQKVIHIDTPYEIQLDFCPP